MNLSCKFKISVRQNQFTLTSTQFALEDPLTFSDTFLNFRYLRDNFIPFTGETPNLFAFITYQGNAAGTVGIAWLGTVCLSNSQIGYRASITEWYQSDLRTAQVCKNQDKKPKV